MHWDEVLRRAPNETGDVHVRGVVVDLSRGGDLLKDSILDDRDPVPHRHRFHLVVGDVDESRLQSLVLLLQLNSGLNPQLGI